MRVRRSRVGVPGAPDVPNVPVRSKDVQMQPPGLHPDRVLWRDGPQGDARDGGALDRACNSYTACLRGVRNKENESTKDLFYGGFLVETWP